MIMFFLLKLCVMLVIIQASAAQFGPMFGVNPPPTVRSLDIDAFMGRWFQMYTSYLPATTFEKNQYCVVNEYSPITSTSFKMVAYAK